MSHCGSCQGRRYALKVHTFFDHGLQTRRLPTLPITGPPIIASSSLWASFSIRVDTDKLLNLRFQASTCTTLIAYCQALVELARQDTLTHAATLNGPTLIRHLPGVPISKQDRAVLASAALQSAVVAAKQTH
jgi:hypothetical protein